MPDGDVHPFPGMEGVEYCPVSIAANLVGDRWSLLNELMTPRQATGNHGRSGQLQQGALDGDPESR
jgi:hypothetical protein